MIHTLAAPALLARAEIRPRRVARWRPVCPECGYSLRRLRSARCPECGVAFPSTQHTFRRWAVRRLTWDRKDRGNLVFAYLRTVLTITFCPCRAARGLAVPDRRGRAVRWGAAHIVVIALLGTLCGSDKNFLYMLLYGPGAPTSYAPSGADPGTGVAWFCQSLGAWLSVLLFCPLLGALLGAAVPGRHPAARLSVMKWSLYAFATPAPILTVFYLYVIANGARSAMPGMLLWSVHNAIPPLNLALPCFVYGIWWALGVAANPYLRRRGVAAFVANLFLIFAVGALLAHVFFNPGSLVNLL